MVQFGDYNGEGGVIAHEDFKATAVATGALHLLNLPWIHTVRSSFKGGLDHQMSTIENAANSANVKTRMMPETVRHILPLADTFDAFLHTLGSHTRRNLRVYRRRIEQKGWHFVPSLTPSEVITAVKTLNQHQGRHQSSEHQLKCCQAALAAVPGSINAGIRTDTGEWASLACGWIRNNQYFMLVQLNDARHARESISTIMRSYLIENLIESGVRSINFIGGCSELLRQFCLSPALCPLSVRKTWRPRRLPRMGRAALVRPFHGQPHRPQLPRHQRPTSN